MSFTTFKKDYESGIYDALNMDLDPNTREAIENATKSLPARYWTGLSRDDMNMIEDPETHMPKLQPEPDDWVSFHDGSAVTTSKVVAEVFGKDHHKVVRAIENLIKRIDTSEQPAKSGGLFDPNSDESVNTSEQPAKSGRLIDQNSEQPHKSSRLFKKVTLSVTVGQGATKYIDGYEMTERGFWRLVMNFNGEKAEELKDAFVDRFFAMESCIRQLEKKNMRLVAALNAKVLKEVKSIGHEFGFDDPSGGMSNKYEALNHKYEQMRRDLADAKRTICELSDRVEDLECKTTTGKDRVIATHRAWVNSKLREVQQPLSDLCDILQMPKLNIWSDVATPIGEISRVLSTVLQDDPHLGKKPH